MPSSNSRRRQQQPSSSRRRRLLPRSGSPRRTGRTGRTPASTPFRFGDLPLDIVVDLIPHLDASALASFRATNHAWNEYITRQCRENLIRHGHTIDPRQDPCRQWMGLRHGLSPDRLTSAHAEWVFSSDNLDHLDSLIEYITNPQMRAQDVVPYQGHRPANRQAALDELHFWFGDHERSTDAAAHSMYQWMIGHRPGWREGVSRLEGHVPTVTVEVSEDSFSGDDSDDDSEYHP